MGPKPNIRAKNSRGGSRRGGGISITLENAMTRILVEDFLLEDAYDKYLNSYHSAKLTANQFYCDINEIDMLGFEFKNLLEFQKLGDLFKS